MELTCKLVEFLWNYNELAENWITKITPFIISTKYKQINIVKEMKGLQS